MGNSIYRTGQSSDRFQAIRNSLRGRRKLFAVAAIAAIGVSAWAMGVGAADNSSQRTTVQSQHTEAKEKNTMTDTTGDRSIQTPQTKETVKDDGNGRTTEVRVNGESITVPENGTYQRTTDTGNGTTDIKVESRNQSNSSGDGTSNSSSSKLEVNVQSNSSSSQ